ncbi:MAG: leucine-rich repeat protein, partial [Oscillospiraceae bacterium]|nr:leucine-rich repeat protein [Oscillospiraceae bacterium]
MWKVDLDAFRDNLSFASIDLGSVSFIGHDAFNGWENATGDLVIPGTMKFMDLRAFYGYASDNENYPSLTIYGGSGLDGKGIGPNIFLASHFKNLTIGGKVEEVAADAFNNEHPVDEVAYDNFTGTLKLESSVNRVLSKAFYNDSSFTSLDLGNVKSIGGEAFSGWENASGDLLIPESVGTIGSYAFDGYASAKSDSSDYPSLTVKGGSFSNAAVTKLGALIFTNSHFRDVTIGGNIDEIDNKAFENSPLSGKNPYNEFRGNLIITDKVSKVGVNAFKNCAGFDGTLDLPDGGYFRTIDNSAFSGCFKFKGGLTIPDGTEVIGSQAFEDCLGFNGTLRLPDALPERNGLTAIGDEAFRNCYGLKGDLTVPATVREIGNSTFEGCTGFNGSIDLGSSIQKIGIKAFKNCTGFKGDLIVPETVTAMGVRAFDSFAAAENDPEKYPALTVNAGDSGNGLNLGALIFTGGHFKNVYVGGKIENIGEYAFSNNPIKETADSEETRPYDNFTGSLTIGSNVKTIGNQAFKNCRELTGTLGFSENQLLTLIVNEAFEGCTGFTGSLNVPDSVQTIGIKTFKDCTGFNGSIKLSTALNKIGAEAFRNCIRIKGGLTIPETVTGGIGAYAFENFASAVSDTDAGKLTIGSGSTGAGKTLGAFIFNGSKFNNMTVGGLVETVSEAAFKHDMTALPATDTDSESDDEDSQTARTVVADYSKIRGTLHVGSSVKIIGNSAFREMSIEGLAGMESVQHIGRYAFWNCDKITSDVTFENNKSLTTIEREAFFGTSGIGSLSIPSTVTFMGPYAFDNSGSGRGSLTIFGASRIEDGKRYLGNNKYSGKPDSGGTLFNHARYRNVVIGGNVDVIDQYFMKSEMNMTTGSYNTNIDHHGITGDLTITGNVSVIEGEAFNDAGFDGELKFNAPNLVTIGYSAFENLPNMHGDLTIPGTVHNIDRRAFKKFAMNAKDGELGTLRIKGYSESNGNQHIIGYRLFSFAHFKSVEIGGEGSTVNTIGNFAFYNSGLQAENVLEDSQTVYEEFKNGYGYTADEIKVYRHLKYDERNEGVKVNNDNSNYSRFTPSVKILDGIETIGTRAFGSNYGIREISFESSTLKNIGKDAFNRCTNAGGGLTIPKSVEYIGRCAFKFYGSDRNDPGSLTILGCSEVKGGVRYIGHPDAADSDPIFPSAKFKNVVIGGSTEEASVNAIAKNFMNNQLKTLDSYKDDSGTYDYSKISGSLTIGPSIKQVGDTAFLCMDSFNGALNLKNGLEKIGESAFNACPWFKGDLLIPQTVNSIGTEAFKHFGQGNVSNGGNTGSLTILGYSSVSGGLKTIDNNIFNHGHYTNVIIGGNVESIADNFMNNQYTDNFGYGNVRRFDYVSGSLTIGSSVRKIGKTAFLSCDKLNGALTLNEGLESIGENAFNACSNFHGDLLIPSTVSSIGTQAFKHFGQGGEYFSDDNQGSLTVLGYSSTKDGLRTIDKDIFNHAHFTNVTIGGELNGHKATVQYIADDFMENNSLENFNGNNVHKYSNVRGNLTIGAGIKKIGSQAFWNCNGFTGVLRIADTVEHIGQSAFSGLYELYSDDSITAADRKLEIPSSVNYIGPYAFKALGAAMDQNTKGQEISKYPAVVVHGSSGPNGVLGDNKAIFSMARINNLIIGGSVVTIADDFMNNERHSTEATRY